ncbi:MAG TPA: hypothetical protein VGD94_15675 [Vicinamibacterales bacterium]
MTAHLFGNRDNPPRGRLRTLSGRLQPVMLLEAAEPEAGRFQFRLHLDDLRAEDLIGGREDTVELDLRDGRRFVVVCVGIDLADRTAVFTTSDLR